MASFIRASRQGCRLLTAYSSRNVRFVQPSCLISTSKKNKDTVAATESAIPPTKENLLDKEEVSSSTLDNKYAYDCFYRPENSVFP